MPAQSPKLVSALIGLTAAALGAGCSKEKEPEVAGYQQGQVQYGQQTGQTPGGYQQQTPPGYTQPGQTPTTTPPPGTTPTGTVPPGTTPTATPTTTPTATPAPAGSKATPIDPAAATIVQPVINELAKANTVAGAKPLGSPLAGNFQTNQTLEVQIQLQPQKCYTVVATSLPPVTELNVQLVAATPVPNLSPVLAIDSETGPTAVVGKKPNCYKWAFPMPTPAKVVLQVTGGSGLAAAQVYEK